MLMGFYCFYRGSLVAAGDAEGEGLADENSIRLPVLAPVACHRQPPGLRPLHAHLHDITRARDVEVPEPIDDESNPAALPARHTVCIQKAAVNFANNTIS
ncbi:hypothetical protein KSP39_PZI013828 [Platanthera zijinensis]|uniref:Uncharacterized protein n=1 Tax=Platanthera zijinensis TaxID=2320716 RepID=A0AAP0BDD8_9ASPA